MEARLPVVLLLTAALCGCGDVGPEPAVLAWRWAGTMRADHPQVPLLCIEYFFSSTGAVERTVTGFARVGYYVTRRVPLFGTLFDSTGFLWHQPNPDNGVFVGAADRWADVVEDEIRVFAFDGYTASAHTVVTPAGCPGYRHSGDPRGLWKGATINEAWRLLPYSNFTSANPNTGQVARAYVMVYYQASDSAVVDAYYEPPVMYWGASRGTMLDDSSMMVESPGRGPFMVHRR